MTLMSKRPKLYVGIDESNEGKNPTIYCAVSSFNYELAITYPECIYSKIRESNIKSKKLLDKIKKLLDSLQIDLIYTVVPSEFKQQHGNGLVKQLVFALLISFFCRKYPKYEISCFIDGIFNFTQNDVSNLIKNLYDLDFNPERIFFIPHGDRKVEIINIADRFAYLLRQLYVEFDTTSDQRHKNNLEKIIKKLEKEFRQDLPKNIKTILH